MTGMGVVQDQANQPAISTRGLVLMVLLWSGGCIPIAPNDEGSGRYNNTTDPTNNGATYIGSRACIACHADVGAHHRIHGHAHILTAIHGLPPEYPAEATRAGVPDPPPGFTWNDIAYVLGGYTTEARFIDTEGYFLTTGETGVPTQWNLASPRNGLAAEFVDYQPDAVEPQPFDAACLSCHVTGPVAQDPPAVRSQENRPGILGTWSEPGVNCEACHGPGSNHPSRTAARDLFVDSSAETCARCHSSDTRGVIEAAGGFIRSNDQADELRASGGHGAFSCMFCHDPHASANYAYETGLRNQCTSCHADQTMAGHRGLVFQRGEYTEVLECQTCHMPFASRSGGIAPVEVVGGQAHMADVRTHIFRINTDPVTSTVFFTDDMSAVRTDESGRAAVTLDFICLRCHNGIGNAFLLSLNGASGVAQNIHHFDRFGSP